jgi:hypothetical protein
MSFEACKAAYENKEKCKLDQWELEVARHFWDAATSAANTRAGDESNEAEKDARRKVAMQELIDLENWYDGQGTRELFDAKQDDILRKCQG